MARRWPSGSGSHRPQTRTAAASSARTACFGDPLLTGSSYSQRCARPDFSGALRPVAPLQWTNVSRTDRLSRAQANAVAELVRVAPVVDRLGALFGAAGHRLYLVGGSVRDALLGRLGHDLDFTTDARPDTIERLLRQLTPAVWTVGKDFGTIGGRITAGHATWVVEITTFRADVYADHSRKPSVVFGDTLDGDLVRRDFTVNAMAVDVDGLAFVDPYGGLRGARRRLPRHPGDPGAVVQGRPAADAPRRPLQLAAGVHHGGAGRTGHARHGRTYRHRLRRTDPRRAGPAAAQRPPAGRTGPVGPDRTGRPGPAGADRVAAGDRRAPSAQGRLRPQPHGARAGHRPRVGAAGAARPGDEAGGAPARHRQAGHPAVRGRRQGLVPPPRCGRGEAGPEAVDRAALQQRRGGRGQQADRAAPALPRVRRRASGATPRSGATSATPGRSSNGCTS